MKQSSPHVKSDWNIPAISHRVAVIIWEAEERQSGLAAGAAETRSPVILAQLSTNRCLRLMSEFPRAAGRECYENT